MKLWNNKGEKFALMKGKLYTPVVGDILDNMGYYHQFFPQDIRLLRGDMKVTGEAMTVLMIDVYGPQKKPFGSLTEALDQLEENEIYIAAGGSKRCIHWGGLLIATARCRKAVGAVVNGWHRDTSQVPSQDWSVFPCSCYAQNSSVRTRVVGYRCDIETGQVTIHDGDLILGDVDGVLIIPKQMADEMIEKALERVAGEKVVYKAIESGMTATAVFERYGILQEWRDAYNAECI